MSAPSSLRHWRTPRRGYAGAYYRPSADEFGSARSRFRPAIRATASTPVAVTPPSAAAGNTKTASRDASGNACCANPAATAAVANPAPTAAPSPPKRASDSSSNARCRARHARAIEKSTPLTNPGIVSACGHMSRIRPSGSIIPSITTPPTSAQATAHTNPMPITPRNRRNQVIGSPSSAAETAILYNALGSRHGIKL
jgi:hypothetical protein